MCCNFLNWTGATLKFLFFLWFVFVANRQMIDIADMHFKRTSKQLYRLLVWFCFTYVYISLLSSNIGKENRHLSGDFILIENWCCLGMAKICPTQHVHWSKNVLKLNEMCLNSTKLDQNIYKLWNCSRISFFWSMISPKLFYLHSSMYISSMLQIPIFLFYFIWRPPSSISGSNLKAASLWIVAFL